jgi:hypothetical protein
MAPHILDFNSARLYGQPEFNLLDRTRQLGSKRKPALDFHGDRWTPTVGRAIDRRLEEHRAAIIDLLDIDPKALEYRRSPDPTESGETIALADLAMEEISSELRRAWGLLRDVSRAASSAQIYRILERLQSDPDRAVDLLGYLDPHVRCLIEDAYPGGWMALEGDGVDPELLRETISRLRAAFPKPQKGRPVGTKDFASKELASGLADIYERFSGKPVTRRLLVDRSKVSDSHREYGPFKDFVDEILAVVPPKLRRTRKGALRSSDYFVRIAVESRKT